MNESPHLSRRLPSTRPHQQPTGFVLNPDLTPSPSLENPHCTSWVCSASTVSPSPTPLGSSHFAQVGLVAQMSFLSWVSPETCWPPPWTLASLGSPPQSLNLSRVASWLRGQVAAVLLSSSPCLSCSAVVQVPCLLVSCPFPGGKPLEATGRGLFRLCIPTLGPAWRRAQLSRVYKMQGAPPVPASPLGSSVPLFLEQRPSQRAQLLS